MDLRAETLSDDDGATGAIVVIGEELAAMVEFLSMFIEKMYPAGASAATRLQVTSGPESLVVLAADGAAGSASIALVGLDHNIGRFVRDTIERRGSALFLFAGFDGHRRVFLKPTSTYLARAEADVDGEVVVGAGGRNWSEFLEEIERQFDFVDPRSL